jgi:hypothetical protein
MEGAVLLSRGWLLLTAPACLAGIVLLVVSIVFLLRTIRVPEFGRLPLVAEQEVERQDGGRLIGEVDLGDSGPLMFVIDKPRFSSVQASAFKPFGLTVSLESPAGRVIAADRVLVPVTVEGMSRSKVDVARIESIQPGRYRLRVDGLASDVSDSFLLVTRPVDKLRMVAAILGIIVSAALTLGGLIGSLATLVKFQSG